MISVGRGDKSSIKATPVLSEWIEQMKGERDRDRTKRCSNPQWGMTNRDRKTDLRHNKPRGDAERHRDVWQRGARDEHRAKREEINVGNTNTTARTRHDGRKRIKQSGQLWSGPSQSFVTQDRNNAALLKLIWQHSQWTLTIGSWPHSLDVWTHI